MTTIIDAFEVLAWQPARMTESSAVLRWLIDFLIRPEFQGHPAAHQVAVSSALSITFAAVVAAILAFLFKLWRESVARSNGARELAYGPRRSRFALALWLFVFLACYASAVYLLEPNSARLIGVTNMMSLLLCGAVIYVAVFLGLHLPAHLTHMPWRRVR